MGEGVSHFIDVCEELEFALSIFLKSHLCIISNLAASFFNEVLAKERLQLFLLGRRELFHVFNYFSKGLTHPICPLSYRLKNTLGPRLFQSMFGRSACDLS